MKRILFFNDSLAMGGTEKLLVDLLNHLEKKECELTLLLPEQSEEDILLRKLSPSIHVKYLFTGKESYIRRKIEQNLMIFFPVYFVNSKGLKESDYDEIFCFKETFYARMFSKMKLAKILWIHNILYKRKYEIRSLKERFAVWLNKKHIKIVQRSYDCFDKVICVSDAAKEAYLSVLHDGKQAPNSVEVLYNAIDLTRVVELSKAPIEDVPQSITTFVLITRLSAEKRIDRLFNVVCRLKNEGYAFEVYLIGEGTDSADMKNELINKGIEDLIIPKGRLDNPFPYVLQSKWSLCVSERESFSLSLLESMALKTPVITTDCGGPRDIVANGQYGILVPNSSEGVYEGMKAVLDDASLSVKYSADLDRAVARFDYNGWLSHVERILEV
ncbi:glycosyltransferase [Dysgonomonas sp. Marseille-P4361]|uniref:glycosyltransferase n=1 Tax=Dysgonomonas sp. Marseille-P4361 TaxID=2161820 RepID=UPI000D55C7D5|nr:glycosyltransferase [Dysgonomonas sp. Marseille-P4361]